jgi:ParB family chromosome partitioning protein
VSNEKQQRRLGRGLEALINSAPTIAPPPGTETRGAGSSGPYREIPLAEIRPNRFQPRREFKPEELAELQASIKSTGLLRWSRTCSDPTSIRSRKHRVTSGSSTSSR